MPKELAKIPIYLKTLVLVLFLECIVIQCKSPNTDCQTIIQNKDKIEILFSDTSAFNFMLSPLEKNKLWVSFSYKEKKIVEVNLLTRQIDTLSKNYRTIFSEVRKHAIFQDNFDSIVWIGGNNDNVLRYNQRTRELTEVPVRYVTVINSQPDRVYFVSLFGLYFWDRKNEKIEKEPAVPLNWIPSSTLLDDEKILLDNKYTFNFAKGEAFTGIQYDEDDHTLRDQLIKVQNGIWIFRNDSTIKIKVKGQLIKELNDPQYSYSSQFLSVDTPYVWDPYDYQHIFTYNIHNQKSKIFWYRIPEINNYGRSYFLKNSFIWIYRPNQLYLISLEDGKLISYPICDNAGFLNLMVNNCYVYLLYKDRIKVYDIQDFINHCLPFDGKEYDNEILNFNHVCDSLKIYNGTNQNVITKKLQILNNQFSNSKNPEVKAQLKNLEVSAFYNINIRFPSYYDSCYKNIELPLAYRKDCLYNMMRQYTRDGSINMTTKTDTIYHKLFGNPEKNYWDYKSTMDSIQKFIFTNTNIDKSGLPKDSTEYYKAISFLTICKTQWFVNEGQCFDLHLANTKLRKFIKDYPNSKLVDNAEYTILTDVCTGGEEEFTDPGLKKTIDKYKKLLSKYPNTDLRPNIEYAIITLYNEMYVKDNVLIKSECEKFIQNHPHSKYIELIKNTLKSINLE